MLVSSKIHNVRLSMHLDQKRFGTHFRQSLKTIQNWENGYVIPTRVELTNISRYTRIALDVFFDKNKAINYIDGKLVVSDDPNGSNEELETNNDTVLEDYPHEDNARYEERD